MLSDSSDSENSISRARSVRAREYNVSALRSVLLDQQIFAFASIDHREVSQRADSIKESALFSDDKIITWYKIPLITWHAFTLPFGYFEVVGFPFGRRGETLIVYSGVTKPFRTT